MIEARMLQGLTELLEDKNRSLNAEKLTETPFSDLGLDSLDQIEFLVMVENLFQIEFLPQEVTGVRTLRAACELVRRKTGAL